MVNQKIEEVKENIDGKIEESMTGKEKVRNIRRSIDFINMNITQIGDNARSLLTKFLEAQKTRKKKKKFKKITLRKKVVAKGEKQFYFGH